MECLKNYRKATFYLLPLICVCCGCAQFGAITHKVTIGDDIEMPDFGKKLLISDPFLVHRIKANLLPEFNYNMASLNGMILCKEGILDQKVNDMTALSFCHDCYSSLHKNKCHFLHW